MSNAPPEAVEPRATGHPWESVPTGCAVGLVLRYVLRSAALQLLRTTQDASSGACDPSPARLPYPAVPERSQRLAQA
jgi:hypothetical protein